MAKTWCKGHISFYQVASVTSCFLVNVLENGLGSIYGVLYTYLKEPFMISDQELTWIGALMTGTIGIVSPFGSLLIETIGARTTCCLGGMIVFASFVIGSQFTNLYSLYVCLGLLPGVGASFFYISGNVQIASMFTKRLPLAVGIASAGNGVGVFLLPLITAWCADAYGWQGGTLILGAVTFHAVLAGRLIKARPLKRVMEAPEEKHRCNGKQHLLEYKDLFTQRCFIVYCFTLILNSMGYHVISMFAPDYIVTSFPDVSKPEAAMVTSAVGVGSLVGRLVFCGISMMSKMASLYLITLSTLLMGVSLIFVPVCQSLLGFIAVGFVFGIGQGGWAGLLTLVYVLLFGLKRLTKSTGVGLFFLGIGFLAGPPLHRFVAETFGRDDLPFYTGVAVFSLSFLICVCILIQVKCASEERSTANSQSIRL